MTEESKPTPTRPNSKWASGRRREIDGPREPAGFHQGARVSKPAPPKANPKRRNKYRRK